MSCAAQDVRPAPDLVLVWPFEREGEHTVVDPATGENRTFFLDHGWDDTFGYAFGTVGAIAANVADLSPGDFITFTRHAYEEWRDEDGDLWLFVNKQDVLGRFVPGENEGSIKEGVEARDRVD